MVLEMPSSEAMHDSHAYSVANTLATTLNRGQEGELSLASWCSPILYMYPRKRNKDTMSPRYVVPTEHLNEKLASASERATKIQAIELYSILSSNAYTKSSEGWMFEKRVHSAVAHSGVPLQMKRKRHILNVRVSDSRTLPTSFPQITAGTHKGLVEAVDNTPRELYWIPSRQNFPGLDSVLIIGSDLYALQITVASEHKSPINGVTLIYQILTAQQSKKFNWHFVIIVKNQHVASTYTSWAEEMARAFSPRPVTAWTCAYPGVRRFFRCMSLTPDHTDLQTSRGLQDDVE